VIFSRPYNLDLITIRHLLDLFGHASGLRTNLAKSSISPIHCTDEELALTENVLSCSVQAFPCTRLGLPLSIGKPTKEVLLPLVDKVAEYLPGWKASLMNRAGRLIMVKVVLTAVPIYLLIALDLPKWGIKAIDKKQRCFFRKVTNRPMVAIAWWLEKKYRDHLSMEAFRSIILNLVVHLRFGGCGHKRQLLKGLGPAFLSLSLIKPGPSSMLQLMP